MDIHRRAPGWTTVVLALFCAWAVYAWPWLSGNYVIPWDNKDQFYPWMRFAVDSLHAGEWPWWNPYVYGGYPAIADPQTSLFSPLAMGLSLLVAPLSMREFDTIVLLHVLVAGVGMLWLGRTLGLRPVPALLAALVVIAGGPVSARLQHSPMIFVLAYVPFALHFLYRLSERGRIHDGALAGAFAGMVALHENQVAYLFVYVMAAFFLSYAVTGTNRSVVERLPPGPLLVAGVVGLLVVSPQLYATLNFLPYTNRPAIELATAAHNSVAPLAFLTLAIPDFFNSLTGPPYWGRNDVTETYLYMGMIPFLLLVGGVLLRRGWDQSREGRLFVALAVVSVLYMLGRYTPFYEWFYALLPGVDLYRRPSDASFVFNFAAAFLAGFALQQVTEQQRSAVRFGPAALVFAGGWLLALVWAVSLATENGNVDKVVRSSYIALLFAAVSLLLFRARTSRRIGWLVVPLLGVLFVSDIVVHNSRMRTNAHSAKSFTLYAENTHAEARLLEFLRRNLHPEPASGRLYRVEFVYAGPLWANAPAVFRLQATQGYNPLLYAHYQDVLGAQNSALETRPFTRLNPGYGSALMDLLGVRYVVTGDGPGGSDKDIEALPLVMEYGPYRIYENPDVYPRLLLVDTLRVVERQDVTPEQLAATDFAALALVDELPPGYAAVPRDGAGQPSAVLRQYANTRVEVEVNTAHPRMLVLNDLHHPGWRAYLNGTETRLYRANLLFRGVWVPAGRHTVEFRFEPFRPW